MLDLGPPPAFYDLVSAETQKAILPGMTPYPGLIGGGASFGDSYLVPKKATVGTSVDTAASGATVAVTVTPSEANGTCFIHVNERNLNLTSGTANIGVSDALGAVWTQVARNDYTTNGPNRETLLFCADLGAVTARAVTLTLGFVSSAVLASPYPMDKGTVVMGSAKGTGAAGDVTLTHGDWPSSLCFLASYNASNVSFVAPVNPSGGSAAQSWTAISNGWSGTSLNMVACFQSTNRDRSNQFNSTSELSTLSGTVVTPFKNGQSAAFTSVGAFTAGGILVGVHRGKLKRSKATKTATLLSANNYFLDTTGGLTTTITGIPLGSDTIEDRTIMICAAIMNLGTRAPSGTTQPTLAGLPIQQVMYYEGTTDSGSIFIGHIPKGTGTSGSLVFGWSAASGQVAVLYSVWILQGLDFPNALQAWTSGNANGSAVTTYSNDRGFIPDNTLTFRHLLQRTGGYGATVTAPATMPGGIYTPDVPSQGVHQGPAGTAAVNNLSIRSNVAAADNQNNALTNISAVQGQTWTSPTASIHKGQSIAVA